MTVKDLRQRLEKLDDDKIVVLSDSIGWSNIDSIKEEGSSVMIVSDMETLFED